MLIANTRLLQRSRLAQRSGARTEGAVEEATPCSGGRGRAGGPARAFVESSAAQRERRDAEQASESAAAWRWAPTLSGFGNARAFNYAGFSGDTSFEYTAIDGNGHAASATVSLHVQPPPAPVDTGFAALSIDGIPVQDQVLTARLGADPDGASATPATFQWFANGVAIDGATASTFTLTADQVGQQITVQASYTDGKGFADSASSAATVGVPSTPP